MEVPNLVTYMEKNMSKMFGVTIIKSPFAPFRLCLSGKAQKNFWINFERYNLANDEDPTVEIWQGISESSWVEDLTVGYTKKVNKIETYVNFHKVVKNHSFWFWRSQKHKEF